MTRRRIAWLVVLSALVLAAPFAGGKVAGYAMVAAPNHGRTPTCDGPPDGASELRVPVHGGMLHAWRFTPTAPRGTVIVLHGHYDDKRSMTGLGRRFAREGYEAVLVDLRGHGCSTGDRLTFGVREGEDVVRVIDALDPGGPVFVYGPSYGGAAALQAAARDPRIEAVVVVATFSSLREVVSDFVELAPAHLGSLVTPSFVARAMDEGSDLSGTDLGRADSTRAIAATHARVLILHGSADRKIPIEHARALHRASPASTLRVLDGRDHDTVMSAPEVWQETLAWFDAR